MGENKRGFVSLSEILSWPRMVSMMATHNDMIALEQYARNWELSKDKTKIR